MLNFFLLLWQILKIFNEKFIEVIYFVSSAFCGDVRWVFPCFIGYFCGGWLFYINSYKLLPWAGLCSWNTGFGAFRLNFRVFLINQLHFSLFLFFHLLLLFFCKNPCFQFLNDFSWIYARVTRLWSRFIFDFRIWGRFCFLLISHISWLRLFICAFFFMFLVE